MNLCKNLLLSRWQFPGPGWESWTVIKDSVMDNILTALLQMISDYSSIFVPSQFSFPKSAHFHSAFPCSSGCSAAKFLVWVFSAHNHCTQGQPWDPKERQMLRSHLSDTTSIPKGKGRQALPLQAKRYQNCRLLATVTKCWTNQGRFTIYIGRWSASEIVLD